MDKAEGYFDSHLHLDLLPNWMSARNRWQGHQYKLDYFKSLEKPVILNVAIYPFWKSGFDKLEQHISSFLKFIENQSQVRLLKSKADLNSLDGVNIVLHLESGRILSNPQKEIEILHNLGVRGIIPVHFLNNDFGFSCDDPRNKSLKNKQFGVKEKGKELIAVCNKYQMWLDISHAETKTAEGIIQHADKVMASHVGLKEIVDSPRNISLLLAQKIAAKNGIIGLMPWTRLNGNSSENYLKAFQIAIDKNLENNLTIGTDFGAPLKTPHDIKSIQNIEQLLNLPNFPTSKILWENGLNWLNFALPR